MKPDKTLNTAKRRPNYGPPAVGFFLAAALFFLVAARDRDRAPWFVLIGALNLMNGCRLARRFRKAAAEQVAAAGDRPQAGDGS